MSEYAKKLQPLPRDMDMKVHSKRKRAFKKRVLAGPLQ